MSPQTHPPAVANVALSAERRDDRPPGTWVVQASFTPEHLRGLEGAPPHQHHHAYEARFSLVDPNLAGSPFPPLGTASVTLTSNDNGAPKVLCLPDLSAELVAEAFIDGAPSNRVDLRAQIDLFDLDASNQHPVGTWQSRGLDLYVS